LSAPIERRERRRRVGAGMSLLFLLSLVAGGTAMTVRARSGAPPEPIAPIGLAPTVVNATLRLDGAVVRGAKRDWAVKRTKPIEYGEPVPVQLTAYCLQGTTRRDNYVRHGIVAADPRVFPLGRYVEVWVGRKYYGRFLVDDTGGVIKDAILDIWTPSCKDARRFGRRRGTAVLVPRPRGVSADSLMTGRLSGERSH
jgi:3D (Asp-Asp-Asp) domain-containing protein